MTTQPENNDEIDLVDLILSIWQKKWWVILFTVIFAAGSVFYALTAKEQWTSKAEVIAPYDYEISHILKDRLAYARITESKPSNLGEDLYRSFMAELRSVTSRVEFLKQSELYTKLTENLSESEKQGILRELATKSIRIDWPNIKKGIDYPTIAFSAESPENAQQTLTDYLAFLNDNVIVLSEKNFVTSLNNQIDDLQFSLQQMEKRLPLGREIRLKTQHKNLERALATAKAAGIIEFTKTKVNGEFVIPQLALGQANIKLSNDQLSNDNFLFLMGEKYLQAQIDNVSKIPLVFPPEYHYKKTQLEQLQPLLEQQKDPTTDQVFHYQSPPYLPLKRDKPKRALIVLIGTGLGGVLGVLAALLISALESRKTRESSAI